METMKAIAKRKSTRGYKPDQIPDDVLDAILAAGCAAPVGMGMYDSLHLTVIQNKEVLRRISSGITKIMNSQNDPLYGIPTLVLLSSKNDLPAPGLDYVNTGCVIENMLIAATDHGIGNVLIWGTGIAVDMDVELRNTLSIPEGFKPIASVGLGYAANADDSEKELKNTIVLNRV